MFFQKRFQVAENEMKSSNEWFGPWQLCGIFAGDPHFLFHFPMYNIIPDQKAWKNSIYNKPCNARTSLKGAHNDGTECRRRDREAGEFKQLGGGCGYCKSPAGVQEIVNKQTQNSGNLQKMSSKCKTKLLIPSSNDTSEKIENKLI